MKKRINPHELEKQKCPTCGRETDRATCLYSDDAPQPGDMCVCIGCRNLHVFADSLALRPVTEKDIEGIPLDLLSGIQRLLLKAIGDPNHE